MRLQADLFPYPVLSKELDDYVQSEFITELSHKIVSPTQVELLITFDVKNPKIESLLAEGRAIFAIHLEGISSSFRRLVYVPSHEKSVSVMLSAEEVSSKLEINKMILANETIHSYTNPYFNSLYYGENFVVSQMNKGDIIAYDSMSVLSIDFENLEGENYQSMIRVAAKDDDYMTVDIDGDFIYISLPKKAYQVYVNLSQNKKEYEQLFLITIIQPSLMYVIEKVQTGLVNEELKWFTSLINLLKQIGYDEQAIHEVDSLKLAQQLLDLPVERYLHEFYLMGDNSDD